MTAPLFAPDGTAQGSFPLDPGVFGIEPNLAVLHQVVTAQLAAARSGSASTKSRAEARGGGRKPWRQKGLGRARQGSIRAPHWAGGGVAHGPKPRSYEERTPKKMKRLALRSALSARAREEAVLVVETIGWATPKTRLARSLLRAMGVEGKALVVVGRSDWVAERSFRNLPQVLVTRPGGLTAYDVLWADAVVFTTGTAAGVGGGSFDVSETDFVKEGQES
ncbi:MAG: 50S ribosomal protein L4 [Acidimicrobiia bacterium]